VYRGILVSGFGGFRGCSIFSGNCHTHIHTNKNKRRNEEKCMIQEMKTNKESRHEKKWKEMKRQDKKWKEMKRNQK